jgi:hypothetical protein
MRAPAEWLIFLMDRFDGPCGPQTPVGLYFEAAKLCTKAGESDSKSHSSVHIVTLCRF